jgi:hypothetical protein
MLEMRDRTGIPGIQLGLEDARTVDRGVVAVPVLILGSSSGAQANLIAGPDGMISLNLAATDGAGNTQGIAAISVSADGSAQFRITGADARPIWEAP